MWFDFNVNEYVRVKLTATAIALLEKKHKEVFGARLDEFPFRMPQVDAEGWSKFQVWDLMYRFGKHMYLGGEPPFGTAIQFEVKEPTPETSDVRHGVNCTKAPHAREGYLHAEDDDSPYDVDGCKYCGRCHRALRGFNAQPRFCALTSQNR